MQFGIFSVGDVTPDPTNERVPTEHEPIKAMVTIALSKGDRPRRLRDRRAPQPAVRAVVAHHHAGLDQPTAPSG